MRKVYVTIHSMMVIQADEDVNISDIVHLVVNECDYNFISNTENADIVDTELLDYEIVDSK